jgi:hypothetical protein
MYYDCMPSLLACLMHTKFSAICSGVCYPTGLIRLRNKRDFSPYTTAIVYILVAKETNEGRFFIWRKDDWSMK